MYKIFDAHCDTIYEIAKQNTALCRNNLHLDIERMERFDTYIQIFAAFVDKKSIRCTPMEHCLALIEKYRRETENGRISRIETIKDLERSKNGGRYAILSIEGGEALGGDISAIDMYYRLGVRLITLTWNWANEIADGVAESRGGGLTEFGREAVKAMEESGIVIDVSHISEKGFWDVAEITKYPFVASHSCAKALCGHRRNLTDEQIKLMIDRNCCIGVNFYPPFLSDNDADIHSITEHIGYMLSLGGKNTVGLGSDFDGVDCLPRGIRGVQDMTELIKCMESSGIDDNVIEKILFKNFYRLFSETLSRRDCKKTEYNMAKF